MTLPPTCRGCKSDRQKLKQILVNLLSNALKYTKEGTVEIIARHDPAHGPDAR